MTPRAWPAEDPGAPYLFFDAYPLDRGERPDFAGAMTHDADRDGDADVRGGILKATDGVAYGYTAWFRDNFARLDGIRGAYHFLQFGSPGGSQAEFYVRTVEAAGGWDDRTIMPIVDVELGGERHPNRRASGQQIIECTSRFAERAKALTGRRVMLYGRGAMRDLGIVDKMGCDCVWNPSYTARMTMHGLEAWTVDDVVLWQYGGDGTGDATVHRLPLAITGLGKIDLSVYVDGARPATMQSLRARLI